MLGWLTDIIKDFEDKALGKMMKYLRCDLNFEKENLEVLKSEIDVPGCNNRLFIPFGRDADVINEKKPM